MKCPDCKRNKTKVLDSRPVQAHKFTRRRRLCLKCKCRFTTYEIYADSLAYLQERNRMFKRLIPRRLETKL